MADISRFVVFGGRRIAKRCSQNKLRSTRASLAHEIRKRCVVEVVARLRLLTMAAIPRRRVATAPITSTTMISFVDSFAASLRVCHAARAGELEKWLGAAAQSEYLIGSYAHA